MGDDDDRFSSDDLGDGRVHFFLVFRVHEGGGLVQHHNGGVLQNSPCQGNALALPAGELFAAVPGHGMDALGKTGEKFHTLGFFRRGKHFFVCGVRFPQADIFQKTHVKEKLFLGYIGNLVVECLHAHLPQILSADLDPAAGHIIVMNQQFCQGRLSGSRFTHQGGEAALRHRDGNPVEHLVFLVGEADVFKGNAVVFAGEGLLFLFQRRGVHQLFQCCDLVVDLGQGGHEAQRPQQRRSRAEGHTEHQGQVRRCGSTGKHQIGPDGQGEQGQAGEDAVIQRHPGPADLVPGQREIPVAPHILLKSLIGFAVSVENLDNLHAVDVFHNGVVHLLGGSVVGPHFAGAGLIHGSHGDES